MTEGPKSRGWGNSPPDQESSAPVVDTRTADDPKALETESGGSHASQSKPASEQIPVASPMTQIAQRAQQVILDFFSPAAVLVNRKYEALYFCGSTERFLARPRGTPTQNLLDLAREGLRSRLRRALDEASATGVPASDIEGRVKHDGVFSRVKLTVKPIAAQGASQPCLLVVFEDHPARSAITSGQPEESTLVQLLEEELIAVRADLHRTTACLAAANEDLGSSRRKLQSLHKELSAINQQLRSEVLALQMEKSRWEDLLAAGEIMALCLDQELRIKSFTPTISKLLQVRPSDVGRPLSDLSPAQAGVGLFAEAAAVLQSLGSTQKELQTDGDWYLRRIVSHRAAENHSDGVIVTFTRITHRRRRADADIDAKKILEDSVEQKVRERTAQLRALAVELTLAEERERRTLAQDLHDNLGQLLAVVKIKLASIGRSERRGNLKRGLADIGELIDQANNASRSLAFQMSPPVLYELGLSPAVDWLADEMLSICGLKVVVRDDQEPKPLEQAVRAILFRAVRESLINVARHSGVNEAEVNLRREGERVAISVSDAGLGFDPGTLSGQLGFGLLSVRERMGFIGGQLRIVSAPGEGTVITLTAPLDLENDGKRGHP